MRMFRSFAFCAIAVLACISMLTPAAAAVLIDPGLHVAVSAEKQHYPAPVLQIMDEVAIAVPMPSSVYPAKVDTLKLSPSPVRKALPVPRKQAGSFVIEHRLRC